MNRAIELGREVVAKRLLIVAMIVGILHVAVALHWVSQGWSDDAVQSVTGGLDALGLLIGGVAVRRAVTPVADPRDNDGDRLISTADATAELHAAREDALAIAAAPVDHDLTDDDVDWPDDDGHTAEHAAPTA